MTIVVLDHLLVVTFASILYAAVRTCPVPKVSKRGGNRSMLENCFTGTAGQLAVLVWLRSLGLPARMLTFFSVDPGHDISVGYNNTSLKIEVKTGYFGDRGADALRLGDKLRFIPRSNSFPDFVFWVILEPYREASQPFDVSLIAPVPVGLVQSKYRPSRYGIPGVRLADVSPGISPLWFAKVFEAGCDAAVRDFSLPTLSGSFADVTVNPEPAKWAFGSHHQSPLVSEGSGIARVAKKAYDSLIASSGKLS